MPDYQWPDGTLSNEDTAGAIGLVTENKKVLQLASVARTFLGAMVGEITRLVETAGNKTYVLDQAAAFAYRVNTITLATLSGTITAKVQIDGVDVTGMTALSVTSTPVVGTSSAARDVAVGSKVTLVTTANSTALDLAMTLKYTRT